MIHCIYGESACLFIDDATGTFEHYSMHDVAPENTDEQVGAWLRGLFEVKPEYEEAFNERRQNLEVFCRCGSYSWSLDNGQLRCSECGDPADPEFPSLLVPECLIGRLPKS